MYQRNLVMGDYGAHIFKGFKFFMQLDFFFLTFRNRRLFLHLEMRAKKKSRLNVGNHFSEEQVTVCYQICWNIKCKQHL